MGLMTVSLSLMAQKQRETYRHYIDQWKETAVLHHGEYGIPASITMAQALLESAAGQSELAVNAKNHFGVGGVGAGHAFDFSFNLGVRYTF